MQTIRNLIVALICASPQIFHAQDAPLADPRFTALLKAYEAELDSFVEAKHKAAIATLDGQLDRALEREEQAAIQAGELDSVTAIRAARQQLGEGMFPQSAVGEGLAGGAIDRLAKLYAEQCGKLDKIRAERIKPRRDSLRKQLAELEVRLTREAKIEQALAVKKYRLTLLTETPNPILPGETISWIDSSAKEPYENFLGMKFVPVTIVGEEKKRKVYFSVWETRVSDFEQFAEEGGQVGDAWKDVRSNGEKQKPDHPVVNVSKGEAEAFCAWLREREPGVPYRLPTDHEWSCAAGIGDQEDPEKSPSSKKNKLPAFDRQSHPMNVRGLQGDDKWPFTAPVDSLDANDAGLHHIFGNVWEIVDSPYNDDPESYTARGLAWNNFGGYLRPSQRLGPKAKWKEGGVGFRIVIGGE